MQLMPDDAERDFCGYGATPPDPRWPGGARVAININLNYEAGGEHSLLEGDSASEGMLNDIGFPAYEGVRSPIVESHSSTAAAAASGGCSASLPASVFRSASSPSFARWSAIRRSRAPWSRPATRSSATAIAGSTITRSRSGRARAYRQSGGRAHGADRQPSPRLDDRPAGPQHAPVLAENGGFLYDRDSLGDELPYWVAVGGQPYLVVPYSFEMNDNRFNENHGFSKADDFFAYLKDGFDLLYEEGADQPKLMSIAIHDRLIGRPARAAGLIRFLDYVRALRRSGSAAASMSPATGASIFRPRRAQPLRSWRGFAGCCTAVQRVAQNERDVGGCGSRSMSAAPSPTSSSRTARALQHVQGADDAGRSGRGRARRAGAGGRRRRAWTDAALLGRDRHVHPRHDARDQRDPDRQHGADRVPHHRGPPRHPGAPRGRPHRAVQLHRALPRALCAARADLRGARAHRRRRHGRRSRSTRRRCSAIAERLQAARGRGGRRLPAVVDRQPGARAARRRAAGASICRACRARCRTSSIRRCASIAAPRRPASTPR